MLIRPSTVIKFERIGAASDSSTIKIPTNDLQDVVRVLDGILAKHGLITGRMGYRWDPEGKGVSYAIREGATTPAAVFHLTNV